MAIAIWCLDCKTETVAHEPSALHAFVDTHTHNAPPAAVTLPTQRSTDRRNRQILMPLTKPAGRTI